MEQGFNTYAIHGRCLPFAGPQAIPSSDLRVTRRYYSNDPDEVAKQMLVRPTPFDQTSFAMRDEVV